MDITPKPFKPTQVVINYKGNETENEIYQIILKSVDEMIYAVNSKDKLVQVRAKLQDSLAVVENRIGKLWLKSNFTERHKSVVEEKQRLARWTEEGIL